MSIGCAETAAQFAAIRQLLAEFTAWDTAQTEAAGLDPGEFLAFYRSEGEEPLPGPYAPPRGCLLLATCGDAPAGCIAFKPLSEDTCEMKRMYVRPEFRGRRVGTALIDALLALARARGYRSIRLETASFMTGAIALYASRGFKIRTPYYEIPPSFGPVTIFMELDLGHAMLHPPILGTSRLRLEPFGPEHFEAFYRDCICDGEVMGFYHAYAAPEPDAQRRARAQRDFLDHFAEGAMQHGYICWALTAGPALAMPTGTFLGWAGILEPALDHSRWGPELAYMLARRCQGQGLATEASTAVLADAWTRYGLQRLHAVVDEPNLPSRRVLERLGFRLHGPVEVYGSAAMLLYDAVAPRHEPKEAFACTD